MHRGQALVFDGDDTLWFVEQLYDDARQGCRRIVSDEGFDGAVWESMERRIDVENVAVLGMSPSRFPLSCIQAYQRLAHTLGVRARTTVEDAISASASSVFRRSAPLVPDAASTLRMLRERFRLALITKGDPTVQAKRLAQSGLGEFFDTVDIVPDKSSVQFEAALRRLGVAAAESWSVGNSLPSDINPALEIGMSAVWIDAHVWEHETRESIPREGRLFRVASLRDVPAVLMDARRAA